MNGLEFLRALWPPQGNGLYCIARPHQYPGSDHAVFKHHVYTSLNEIAATLKAARDLDNLYFSMFTLAAAKVWDPTKKDPKTGERTGGWAVRKQSNSKVCRCFFFDIDVGQSTPRTPKYDSQRDAVIALKNFCQATGLPQPLVSSSGGGLHSFHRMDDAIEAAEWRRYAKLYYQLARHYGLKVDPSRTTDTSSVLRVVGTINRKPGKAPRPVKVLVEGVELPTEELLRRIVDAGVRVGLQLDGPALPSGSPTAAALPHGLQSNVTLEYDGPATSWAAVVEGCAQAKRNMDLKGCVSEPEWYHWLQVIMHCEDGEEWCHEYSSGYDGYDADDVDNKIAQLRDRGVGPTSCEKLRQLSGEPELCDGCPHWGKVKSPIVAGRSYDTVPMEPTALLSAPDLEPIAIMDPPYPYKYTKSGVMFETSDKDGEPVSQLVIKNRLYPIARMADTDGSDEKHVWHADLLNGEAREFHVPAGALYDQRRLFDILASNGVYPSDNSKSVGGYMVAYIQQLQAHCATLKSRTHLGWTDDYTSFVLPDRTLKAGDEKPVPSMLTKQAQRVGATMGKTGTLDRQVELMHFFNKKEYVPNQFMILAGLGSILYYMTGYHGVILHGQGDPGSSKSTSLYTMGSLWGDPDRYVLNGTNRGATGLGLGERMATLANLPVGVDEITYMQQKDVIDFAMSVTQPGHRLRLGTDGAEKRGHDVAKSAIAVTTANVSLHPLLAHKNSATTAGSMRVFEVTLKLAGVHTQDEADDFLRELRRNYGHIGPAFAAQAVQVQKDIHDRVIEATKDITKAAGLRPAERFWGALISAVVVAAEYSKHWGLLPFDPQAILDWAIRVQIPRMRGVVEAEYNSPLTTLGNFIESINGNLVITSTMPATGRGLPMTSIVREPHGPLYAHYDTTSKAMWVMLDAFKNYCMGIGANYREIIETLGDPIGGKAVISIKAAKNTLGKGTNIAKLMVPCFCIDMGHPDVSMPQVEADPPAQRGNLRVVK